MNFNRIIQGKRILTQINDDWIPYLKSHPQLTEQYFQILRGCLRYKTEPELFRGVFESGQLKAIALVYPVRDALFIHLLIVAPHSQGQGWGKTMLNFLGEEAIELGRMKLQLNSIPGAVGFYKKLGFEIIKLPEKLEWDTKMQLPLLKS